MQCLCAASEGAKNLKVRFESMAKDSDEENRKKAEEERARRQAKESREREEAKRRQQVKTCNVLKICEDSQRMISCDSRGSVLFLPAGTE